MTSELEQPRSSNAETPDPNLQHHRYTPGSPLQDPVQMVADVFRDLWWTRELIWILFVRDLKAQFRQSLLGYAWLIIPPLASAAAWYLLNRSGLMEIDTGEQPYAHFVLVGTTVWSAFAATITTPMAALSTSKEVFIKLNVPLESFILASTGKAVFNLLISSAVMFGLLFLMGVELRTTFLVYPFAAMAVVAMGLTCGLFLAPLSTLYTDVASAVTVCVGLLMFTVPVIVDLPADGTVPGVMGTIIRYNPLTPAIALCRDSLLTGRLDWLGPTLFWLALSAPTVLAAVLALRIAKPHVIARLGM